MKTDTARKHLIFRVAWRSVNVLFAVAVVSSIYAGVREYSVRRYLTGFSDAVVPESATPEQKIEAILAWMKNGPSRYVAPDPSELSVRDPENTLNYKQLLTVCGTATNAFLNLARSGGLSVRRLLLLTPDRNTKHVVAEVLVNDRWIIVDPAYRVILRNAKGQTLTRGELKNPGIFAEAISAVPDYPRDYSYENYAHIRLARVPMDGLGLRRLLDTVLPGWDESLDWSLLLERESFSMLVMSLSLTCILLVGRLAMAWYADSRLRIPRFHLREHAVRAGAALFFTPEIKR